MIEKESSAVQEPDSEWNRATFLSSLQVYKPIMEKAGFWRRYFAFAIDWFILGLVDSMLYGIGQRSRPSDFATVGLYALVTLIHAMYFAWPYSRGGQTIGKRLLGIRVMSIDGTPLSWRKGIGRTLGYIPSTLAFYIGFLWAIWDGDKQAWQDKVAGTLVVRASSASDGSVEGYIDLSAAKRRQRRWQLGLGIPTALLIAAVTTIFGYFFIAGLAGVDAMGEWPGSDVSPEEAVDVNLAHLDLELVKVIDAREESTWASGQYEQGVLVIFHEGGKEVVAIWALKYADADTADSDFEMAMAYAEDTCFLYMTRNLGRRGMVDCKFTNAYNKILLNDNWILDVLALQGSDLEPMDLVDQILESVSDHWRLHHGVSPPPAPGSS